MSLIQKMNNVQIQKVYMKTDIIDYHIFLIKKVRDNLIFHSKQQNPPPPQKKYFCGLILCSDVSLA